jgi:hypothetical protein
MSTLLNKYSFIGNHFFKACDLIKRSIPINKTAQANPPQPGPVGQDIAAHAKSLDDIFHGRNINLNQQANQAARNVPRIIPIPQYFAWLNDMISKTFELATLPANKMEAVLQELNKINPQAAQFFAANILYLRNSPWWRLIHDYFDPSYMTRRLHPNFNLYNAFLRMNNQARQHQAEIAQAMQPQRGRG